MSPEKPYTPYKTSLREVNFLLSSSSTDDRKQWISICLLSSQRHFPPVSFDKTLSMIITFFHLCQIFLQQLINVKSYSQLLLLQIKHESFMINVMSAEKCKTVAATWCVMQQLLIFFFFFFLPSLQLHPLQIKIVSVCHCCHEAKIRYIFDWVWVWRVGIHLACWISCHLLYLNSN